MSLAPRVSVIIPTRNRGALLRKAVRSALDQTFTNLEILVIDDASTEDTRAALGELFSDPRLSLLQRPYASGTPAIPRNDGLARARGELVAFLDSDDLWYPQKLETQIAYLDANPACALVASRCRFIGDEHLIWPDEQLKSGYRELLHQNFIGCSMTLVRTSVVRALGGFDPTLDYAEDRDLWLRIAKDHLFFVLPDVLGDYLVHSGGQSRHRLRELRGTVRVLTAAYDRDPAQRAHIAPDLAAERRALAVGLWEEGHPLASLWARLGIGLRSRSRGSDRQTLKKRC